MTTVNVHQKDPTPSSQKIPTPSSQKGPVPFQFPEDEITQYLLEDQSQNALIRAVAMGEETVGEFDADTEYWYTSSAISIENVTEVTLRSESDEYTEQQILNFLDDFDKSFTWTQDIGTGGWTQGTYTPTEEQVRLYKATDPDNSSHKIGLLIEQDRDNKLTAITWYKRTNTGEIFASPPTSLTFTLVLTSTNQPSTNPNDISNNTWYYATSTA